VNALSAASAVSVAAKSSMRAGPFGWLTGPLAARAARVGVCILALASAAGLLLGLVEHRPEAQLTIAVAGVVLLAAVVSSVAGFAFSALAGSALAYLGLDPVHSVETLVVCSTASQLYAVWSIRQSVRWRELGPTIAAGLATVPLGVWLLVHVPSWMYAAGLGAFLVLYGGYVVLRREELVVRGTVWHDAAAGALGGLVGGLAGFPGAFVTIWCGMRGWDKLRQRAMYQPYILVMQIATLACLVSRSTTRYDVARDLWFVPFALLGTIGGLALFQRLTGKQFHAVVSVLLVASGFGLLARALA
jgi:uncharacterized membrane protein YfcA